MERRLYRSRRERMISGVCGGIAEYFDIDPTFVRLLAVLLTFVGVGTTVIVYIVMAILVPEAPLEPGYEGASDVTTPLPPTPPPVPQQTQPAAPPPAVPAPPAGVAPAAVAPPAARRHRGGIGFGVVLVFVGLALLASQLVPGLDLWRLWPLVFVIAGLLTIFRGGGD